VEIRINVDMMGFNPFKKLAIFVKSWQFNPKSWQFNPKSWQFSPKSWQFLIVNPNISSHFAK